MNTMAGLPDLIDRFDRLAMDQRGTSCSERSADALFIYCSTEIVSEAQRDVEMWKGAYSSRTNEITALRKELAELKQAKIEVCPLTPWVRVNPLIFPLDWRC